MSQPTLMIAKKGKKVRFDTERLNNQIEKVRKVKQENESFKKDCKKELDKQHKEV